MPPTFLYILALCVWVCVALLVWLVSALLLIPSATRRVGRSLASAMACTFPAVLAAQLLAAPVAVCVLGVALLSIHIISPNGGAITQDPVVIGAGVAFILVELLLIGGASLLGFFEGWRAGWLLAKGRGLRSVMQQGPSARMFRSFRTALGRRRAAAGPDH